MFLIWLISGWNVRRKCRDPWPEKLVSRAIVGVCVGETARRKMVGSSLMTSNGTLKMKNSTLDLQVRLHAGPSFLFRVMD